MEEKKKQMWDKVRSIDKYCVFCGREVYPWDGEFSTTKNRSTICFHRECLKRENEKNRRK